MPALLYARISSDRDGEGAGVARQEEDCRALADRLGEEITGVYVDNDLTASTGRHRPGYGDLLDAVTAGQGTVIIVWHLSRLWRNRAERAAGIELLKQHRVRILSVRGPDLDLSTAYGRTMAGLLGEFDTMESEVKSERIARRMQQNAREGKAAGGGSRPFGYEQDRVTLVPAEAALIREAADRILAGESLNAVAKDFNARGIRTASGTLWAGFKLKRVLVSARVAGMREHQPRPSGQTRRALIGEIVGPAVWPAIITETELTRLRAILTDPERRVSPGRTGRYLLSGLVFCLRCRHRMVGRPRGDGRGRYVCDRATGKPSCGLVHVLADHLEDYVIELAAGVLSSPDYRRQLSTAGTGLDPDEVMREVRDAEQELRDLAADHGARRISRGEWMAAREPVQARLESWQRQLSATDAGRALEGLPEDRGGLEAFLRTGQTSRRRAVLAATFASLTVDRAVQGRNRFDPERVGVEWRI